MIHWLTDKMVTYFCISIAEYYKVLEKGGHQASLITAIRNHLPIWIMFKIQKEERIRRKKKKKEAAMHYSFHSFNNPGLTGAANSKWTPLTRQHPSSPSKGIWMHSSHWGEKGKKTMRTPQGSGSHFTWAHCETPTTSSCINCYNSFHVPGCWYITSHRSTDTEGWAKQYDLHINTNTPFSKFSQDLNSSVYDESFILTEKNHQMHTPIPFHQDLKTQILHYNDPLHGSADLVY